MANISPLLSFFPDDRLVDTWEGGTHQRLPQWRLDWEDALRAGEPYAVPSSGRANAQAPSVPLDSMPQPFFPKPWGPAVPSGGTPVFPGFPQGYPTLPWNPVPMRPRTDVNASPEGLKNQNQGPRYTNDQLGLTNDTLAQQPTPAPITPEEQVANAGAQSRDPRYGIQPRTDQGFGSYQPSAADFGEKQTKQQSPFNSDAGMWGILAAGLGILANNYGNYGQAGPAIGKGGMMGLNTFLEQRQIAERNKFAQQELDQRAKRDASLDRYYDAQADAMERNADTNRMKAEQKKYQYKQLKNGGVAIFEGGKLLKVAERPEDFTELALSLADTDDEKAYARSDPEGFIEFKGQSGAKLARAKAGAANIGLKLELDQGKAFTGPIAEEVKASHARANAAIKSQQALTGFQERLNDPKLIAGIGANARIAAAQVAQMFGGDGADLASTRQVIQGLAELTLQSRDMLKGQGQVTEYEQKTLEKARSGDISMTIPELKTLVKVLTRMNKAQYDAHSDVMGRLVEVPGSEQAQKFFKASPFPGGDAGKDPWEK
jgi:hypothetical protein